MSDAALGIDASSIPIYDLSHRIAKLEEGHAKIQEKQYNSDLELVSLKKDIAYIRENQDKLNIGINRVLWAVILSFIGYAVAWIARGGLDSVPTL